MCTQMFAFAILLRDDRLAYITESPLLQILRNYFKLQTKKIAVHSKLAPCERYQRKATNTAPLQGAFDLPLAPPT